MKKALYIAFVVLSALFTQGCDSLDVDNIYSYDANKVKDDANLLNAYLSNIYSNTFPNWDTGVNTNSLQCAGITWYPDAITQSNSNYKLWSYSTIYQINDLIESAEAGSLPEATKNGIIGQAEFMRAYLYFNMVVYHGGIPYITKTQDKDVDSLYVKRNSTAECFDLIIKDIDDAISKLPATISKSSSDYGRIDGDFARAFKAKVLLQKASPQFHPKHPWDNSDWQAAYTACKDAYTTLLANGYKLTEKYEDIFTVEKGPEVVFAVINQYPNKVADWWAVNPGSLSRDNPYTVPTWEFVKEFPMADGKQPFDPTGKYYVKSEDDLLQCYWENRDPRFLKSFICNGNLFSIAGTPANRRQYTALGIAHELDDFGTNPAAKINSTNLNEASGLFIRKAIDVNLSQAQVQRYDIDHIIMRFAEVMLNYAETANETGHQAEAIDMLKQIRQRAGIEPGADGNYGLDVSSRESIREAILQERNIEFCFEGTRFWDLRRLRMLNRLDGATKHGIEAIAINPDGTDMAMETAKAKAANFELTEKDFRYILHQIPFSGVKVFSVPDTYYFFPLQTDWIDRNHNLEQNSNWGGSFNPALE